MKIKDYKCNCGCNDFFFADKGNQKGLYCSSCGKWFKWAGKDEQNLQMKQVSALDKVKAEISEELKSCPLSEIEGLRHALAIIEKYKSEGL